MTQDKINNKTIVIISITVVIIFIIVELNVIELS